MKRSMSFALLMLLAIWCGSALAQTKTPTIDKREHRQQVRIHEGVKSGELTPGETRRLEAQQGKINVDEAKAKSDGVVTARERAKLMKEQNRASRNIYRKKHNARVRKP